MCRTSARQFRMQWSSARSPRPVDFRRAIHRQRRRVLDLDPVRRIGRHDRRDLAASRPSLPVPSCKRRGIGRGRSRPARRVQQISLLADAPTDDPSWFSACSTAIGGSLRRRARERRRRRAAPLHHVCVSSVASVNTTSPSCSADRTASLGGTAQYGRKRPWPLEHRTEQSPLCWAFKRLLQIARSPNLGRNALAQLLEPPCTDPYARWCGRGGAERLPPIPISPYRRRLIAQ